MAETRIPSLSEFREYLWLLARLQIVPHLQSQLDPSDIVQETLLKAQRAIGQFTGKSEGELAAWLRRILANTLTDAVRKLHRGQGEPAQSLEAALEESSGRIEALLAVNEPSPSQQASHNEQLLRLAQALARLPKEQRAALEMKHLRGLSIEEISNQLKRTKPAIVGLLYRGIKRLREVLNE